MKVRFTSEKSDKVLASFTILVDELPAGLAIGGGYVGKDKAGKPTVAFAPPFARNAGIVPAVVTAMTEDGEEVAVPSSRGRKALAELGDRILKLWDGKYEEYGL